MALGMCSLRDMGPLIRLDTTLTGSKGRLRWLRGSVPASQAQGYGFDPTRGDRFSDCETRRHSCMWVVGDGPHNFKPWSREENDT
ncbi:hypothetical protein TNCV_2041931 [Trichonephila clavipes]|nr:hypothetical protein TNCV_2041931 [Trichonephila clavipes]